MQIKKTFPLEEGVGILDLAEPQAITKYHIVQ